MTMNHSLPLKSSQLRQFRFDPREGYFFTSSFHLSGFPLLDKSCHLQGLTIRTNFDQSMSVVLKLDHYKDWIKTALNTYSSKHKIWKRTKDLKKMFFQELRASQKCQPKVKRNFEDKMNHHPQKIIQPKAPEFQPLSEDLRVITECGVEVRLKSGIIHSPILFRDVRNSSELLELFQKDYRYRPNQKCEWVITAPMENQKVGLQFHYFDLHEDFDRLEIEENGETISPSEVKPT